MPLFSTWSWWNWRIFDICLGFPHPERRAESYCSVFKGNLWIVSLLHLKIPSISGVHSSVLPGSVQQTKHVGLKGLHHVWLDVSQKPQAECVCAAHTVCTYISVWEMPGSTHHWQMLVLNENYCADRSLAALITCEQ